MMMWQWFHWGIGGLWWIMPLIMVVFWGLVIWGILVLVRRLWGLGNFKSNNYTETALDNLKRRYVKGEISKNEFEEKKKDLV